MRRDVAFFSPGFRFVCRHSVRRRAVRSHDAAPRAPAAMAGRRRDAHALRLPRGRRSGVDAARAREGDRVRAVSPRLASEEPRRPSSWFSNFVDSSAASVSSYSVALLVPLPDRRTNPRDDARCDELRFLRALVLDGDFDAAASFLEPLRDADDDDAKNQNHQNRRRHASARAALGRQAFLELLDAPDASASDLARSLAELEPLLERRDFETLCYAMTLPSVAAHDDFAGWSVARGRLVAFRRVVLTLVPIRPRRRGERRSLRTFPGVSLRPSPLGFNPDTPRRLSTPSDAFQLHPDVALNDGPSTLSSPRTRKCSSTSS